MSILTEPIHNLRGEVLRTVIEVVAQRTSEAGWGGGNPAEMMNGLRRNGSGSVGGEGRSSFRPGCHHPIPPQTFAAPRPR